MGKIGFGYGSEWHIRVRSRRFAHDDRNTNVSARSTLPPAAFSRYFHLSPEKRTTRRGDLLLNYLPSRSIPLGGHEPASGAT